MSTCFLCAVLSGQPLAVVFESPQLGLVAIDLDHPVAAARTAVVVEHLAVASFEVVERIRVAAAERMGVAAAERMGVAAVHPPVSADVTSPC